MGKLTIREAISALEHADALNEAGLLGKSAAMSIKAQIGEGLMPDSISANDIIDKYWGDTSTETIDIERVIKETAQLNND